MAEGSIGEPSFPRGRALPRQSPLFWIDQKDRYLRQLMLRDLEERTGRKLLVYFTDSTSPGQIDIDDDRYLLELVHDCPGQAVDLMLETNGGITDATEKLVSVLLAGVRDLRVLVPRRAKSNGTLLALAAQEIVMGPGSELGPMDPFVPVQQGYLVPAQYILEAPEGYDPIVRRFAEHAIMQTHKLALRLLRDGMLAGSSEAEIARVVAKLATRDVYHSHGSVIDAREAESLGLRIARLRPDDEFWRWLWLLRCMYEADARQGGFTKIFEGRTVSHSIRAA